MNDKVLSLADRGRVDIAGHLRKLADAIEAGETPELIAAVVVLESRDTISRPYVFGQCDTIRAVGLMSLAAASLIAPS